MLSAKDKEYIITSIANGDTIANVSIKLNKTEKEIKEQLLNHICEEINNKKGIVSYYSNEFNIPTKDIIEYESRCISKSQEV